MSRRRITAAAILPFCLCCSMMFAQSGPKPTRTTPELSDKERIKKLEARILELETRLAALEKQAPQAPPYPWPTYVYPPYVPPMNQAPPGGLKNSPSATTETPSNGLNSYSSKVVKYPKQYLPTPPVSQAPMPEPQQTPTASDEVGSNETKVPTVSGK